MIGNHSLEHGWSHRMVDYLTGWHGVFPLSLERGEQVFHFSVHV